MTLIEHLPRFPATRYVIPLREGGTLPAIVEGDPGSLWVVKFRGAGQGARALIAEVLAGELARVLGLPVPVLAEIHIPEGIGRGERDPEIQDLLRASRGANIGMAYLPGALNFDPGAAGDLVDPTLATRILWLDALIMNPDRTPRNPNLLIHEGAPWIIDHGASLYPHFNWSGWDALRAQAPFDRVADHVLLPRAEDLRGPDAELAGQLVGGGLETALSRIPESLLDDPLLAGEFSTIEAHRDRYRQFLLARLTAGPRGHRPFAEAAEEVRREARQRPIRPLEARR
jgi:hypothetical protein